MPEIDKNTVVVALWALAVIVLAWSWVPALISALGGTRFLCGGSLETYGMEPSAKEPDYSYWAEQLLAAGFEPLGNAWMRTNFAASDWSLYSDVRVFRHPQAQCFAFMQKAPAPFNFWPGVVFATCWADGRLLITDNNSATDPKPDAELIRQGVVSLRLDKVLSFHLATMEVLRRSGSNPDPELTIDTLIHSWERHLGPEQRGYYGHAARQYLFVHGLVLILLTSVAAYFTGITEWQVPVTNLAIASLLFVGESSQKRQYARAARTALRDLQAMPEEQRREVEIGAPPSA
jgi:hypothetical protein